MSNLYLLGLDIGTSSCKSIIINENGEKVASSTTNYPIFHPKDNWSEQNPDDWWKATIKAIKKVVKKSKLNSNDIVSLGLTGQMHGLIALDDNNDVLRPAILWNDQRTSQQCSNIVSAVGGNDQLLKYTNNTMLNGYTAPKLIWLRENEPEIFEKIKIILNPKDFIRFKLTGKFATDVSDASGTGLFNVKKRKWSKKLLNILDIPEHILPPVYESTEVTGIVKKSICKALGLKEGIIVAAGGGDAVVQTTGTGLINKDVLGTTIGTAGIVSLGLNKYENNKDGNLQVFCNNEDNRWHIMGVNLSSGGAYKWYKDNLCRLEQKKAIDNNRDVYSILDQEVNSILSNDKKLIFLPYLIGERCPHPDPTARGSFIGLSLRHTHADLTKAVQEGIIFNLRQIKDLIVELDPKIKISEIRTSGGASKSRTWKQIQANIFQLPVKTVVGSSEGAAYGAALLAGVACNAWNDLEEAVSLLKVESVTLPDTSYKEYYNNLYKIYNKLYYVLKDTYKELFNL